MKRLLLCALLTVTCPAHGQDDPPGFENVLEGVRQILQNIDTGPRPKEVSEPPFLLSAKAAVQLALQENPQVFRTQADVDAAVARIQQTKSAFYPQIDVSVAFRFQDGAGQQFSSSFLTELIAPGGTSIEELTRADRLSIGQTLYTGGQLRAALKASKYLAQSEQWQRVATLDDIEFQTKQAYYDCLLAHALVVVAEDSVATFRRHAADTQQMFDVGLVSRFEVTRAETELGSRQADVVEAGNRLRLAYTNLRRLLSISQSRPLTLTDRFVWVPLDKTLSELIAEAKERRPELLSLQNAIVAADADIRRLKGRYRPQVAAETRFTALDGAGAFVPEGWSANVGVQWDLFTGSRRRYEVKEAKARSQSLHHQVEEVELIVEFDVRRAHIQVEDATAKIQREDGNVTLAREGQRLAAIRFQEGIHTQADVLDAELALTNAQTQLVVALREYAVAHAALSRSLGRSWVDRDSWLPASEPPSAWKKFWR